MGAVAAQKDGRVIPEWVVTECGVKMWASWKWGCVVGIGGILSKENLTVLLPPSLSIYSCFSFIPWTMTVQQHKSYCKVEQRQWQCVAGHVTVE
jgi:hypothetical protein